MNGGEQVRPYGWLRVYRPAWWSVAGLVGAVGVAGVWLELGSGSALLLLAGFSALAALGVWQFGPQQGDGRPGRSAVLLGTAYTLGFLALIGLGYLAGAVGFAAGVAVGAAGWPVLRRRRPADGPEPAPTAARREPPRPAPGRPRALPAAPGGPARESVPVVHLPEASALGHLSTPQLCWTWRASYVCLRRSPWPSYVDSLAGLRQACLDELERRDPVAFGRWFPTARAASDPARYFCKESQR